ncbi:Gfo/Idh/MocA family protein [Acidisoma sp. 7E03]
MTRIVNWGVLSTAKIAREKVIPAMQKGESSRVLGLASRDEDTAQRAAAELGIPRAYGSYEALLADPDIEAVYNPLPNHLHVPWSIKALEAGKHVLCEKPIALDTKGPKPCWRHGTGPASSSPKPSWCAIRPGGNACGRWCRKAGSAASQRSRPSSATIWMTPPTSATCRRSAAAG